MSKRLTPAQKRFFASYIEEFSEDILPRSVAGMTPIEIERARGIFYAKAANTDFDGAASSQEIRVAKNLKEAGFLSEVEPHGTIYSETHDHLYVVFDQAGLGALFTVATGVR